MKIENAPKVQPITTEAPLSSRRAWLGQAALALVSFSLPEVKAAQPIFFSSPGMGELRNSVEKLSPYTMKELHFDSKYDAERWLTSKLERFQDGEFKIQGCTTVPQAANFLAKCIDEFSVAFDALGSLHQHRKLEGISDDLWFGPISDNAAELRRAHLEFSEVMWLSKELPADFPNKIKESGAFLVDTWTDFKQAGNNATTIAIVMGVVALIGGAYVRHRDSMAREKDARTLVHDRPGAL